MAKASTCRCGRVVVRMRSTRGVVGVYGMRRYITTGGDILCYDKKTRSLYELRRHRCRYTKQPSRRRTGRET